MIGLIVAAEGGFEAPGPWFAETYEVILGSAAAIIIFALLYKFGNKPVRAAMAARTQRIQDDLDRAAAARVAAEGEASRVKADLVGADTEAERIIAEARRSADELKSDQLSRLDAELVEIREKAVADIQVQRTRSLSEVQGSVARLAVGAADRIVRQKLDPATQQALVETYIDQVGRMSHV